MFKYLYNSILKLMMLGCVVVVEFEQACGLHGIQGGLGRYYAYYFY
jgi:hypothetical protein